MSRVAGSLVPIEENEFARDPTRCCGGSGCYTDRVPRTIATRVATTTVLVFFFQAFTVCVVEGFLQQREVAVLRAQVTTLRPPADPIAKVLSLAEYVRDDIKAAGLDANAPRPFLRATAQETLHSGRGFCGEQARLLIRLLHLSGFDAHRVYLWNATGEEHVVVEAVVAGRLMTFETLASRPDEHDLQRLMAAEGFTHRAYWSPRAVRAIGRDPFEPGSFWARIPPPRIVAGILESPHAIPAALSGTEFVVLGFAAGAFRLRRRKDARAIEGRPMGVRQSLS